MRPRGRPPKVISSNSKQSTVTYAEPPDMGMPNIEFLTKDIYDNLSPAEKATLHEKATLLAKAKEAHENLMHHPDPLVRAGVNSDVQLDQASAEQLAQMEIQRQESVYNAMQQQAAIQNAQASLIEGHPVEEGLARPYAGPVHISEVMRMEDEARANGTPFVMPQSIFVPPAENSILPSPPPVQHATSFLSMPHVKPEM